MRWALPLGAISTIADLNLTEVSSINHYHHTIEPSAELWPWRAYRTSAHTPPYMKITRIDGKELMDGYVFITPSNHVGSDGTYELSGTGFIMTDDGELIFAANDSGYEECEEWVAGMADFRVQEYNGKPYLTYWNGCNIRGAHWGHRWGTVTFMDEEYTNFTLNPDLDINTMDYANTGKIDVHEHEMTDRNTMLITSYNNTPVDLTSLGGDAEAWLADSMFFEIDVETHEVLFEWKAVEHTPYEASRFGLTPQRGTAHVPWDWFHINSIQRVDGNYLISARHHWALYLVDGTDGSVIWKLDGIDGGDFGSIPMPFRWQHHSRAYNVSEHGMTVTLFNNNVAGAKNKKTQSQAMAYWLPMPASPDNPPVLVKNLYTEGDMAFAGTQGSYQIESLDGNAFVGYGNLPLVREYGPDGQQLWQAWFGGEDSVMSYRAFKQPWRGTPKDWDPVVVFVQDQPHKTLAPKVYVSWNGATDISGWAIFAGPNEEDLQSYGLVPKMGFETEFDLDEFNCVQLGAIRDKEIIRASNIACLHPTVQDSPSSDGEKELEDEIARLKAEKELLKSEMDKLRTQGKQGEEEPQSDTWASYRLFGEVAIVIILIVLGTWGYVLWRNSRLSQQYSGLMWQDDQPDRDDSGIGRSILNFRTKKRNFSLEIPMMSAAEYDETKLDELAPEARLGGDRDGNFGLADDESEDEGLGKLSARTPFLRPASGT